MVREGFPEEAVHLLEQLCVSTNTTIILTWIIVVAS